MSVDVDRCRLVSIGVGAGNRTWWDWLEEEQRRGGGGALGVYSRPTVPRPVNTGDSHSCERPKAVPDRPNRPRWSYEVRPVRAVWRAYHSRDTGAQLDTTDLDAWLVLSKRSSWPAEAGTPNPAKVRLVTPTATIGASMEALGREWSLAQKTLHFFH